MLSASEYYINIVKPTAVDFFAKNRDARLAMLACMATLHTTDYIFQNNHADSREAEKARREYEQDAIERCFSLKVVRGFALASKHCRLSQRGLEGFHSRRYMVTTPSIMGRMVLSRTFLGDTVGGVAVHWSEFGYVNLTKALKATHRFLESEFPELVPAV